MRRLRRAFTTTSLVLMLATVLASGASGATLKYGNPPAAVPTGSTLQGALASSASFALDGTVFGSAARVQCGTFAPSGAVGTNPGSPVSGIFSTVGLWPCSSTLGGCTVAITALPWDWSLSTTLTGANVGGTFTTEFDVSFGGCFPFGMSCRFQGAGGGTAHTVSGTWTGANLGTSSPATVSIAGAPVNATATTACGTGWTLTTTLAMTATVGGVSGQHLTLDN